jgi:hypothetical protein
MSYIIEKIEQIKDDFDELKLKQLICDCDWCKINIDRCDNDRMMRMLDLTVRTERYELSSLIKSILDERKIKNIVYTDDYKRQLVEKQKEIVKRKNSKK